MEELVLLISYAADPTFTYWPVGYSPTAQSREADSTVRLLPAFAFEPLLLFLLWLSFSEPMCLPSGEMSGERGCQPPGILSVSAHVLAPSAPSPSWLSVHEEVLVEAGVSET